MELDFTKLITMDIREATIKDGIELARLRWDFSPEQVAADRETYQSFCEKYAAFLSEALVAETWKIWVAEEGSRLVGNVYVKIIPKLPRPGEFGNRYAYMTNVYVEEAFRNHGIGRKLVEAAATSIKAAKLEFMIVWPSTDSVPFYERLGFVRSESMEVKP